MKLFIDCRMIGSGGIGSYLSALLPFFINDFDCILLGKPDTLNEYKSDIKVQVIETDVKPFSINELLTFPKTIINIINSCDIYYSPYFNIPKGIKIPVCTTIHDVLFLDIPKLAGKTGTLIRKWFYQHACNKSNIIFTVSEFSKNRIEKHLQNCQGKIIITYNAVPQWFKTKKHPTVKDGSILFVGNIKKHKGLSTLLDAISIVHNSGIKTKLKIVGNSENFRTGDEEIAKKIQSLSEDHVIFTGYISEQELQDNYASANLLVQPSFYEGFGMPPLEALSLGTNVIISDIPVFKEIYQDFPVTFFKCGDSIDLAEKIQEIYNKPFYAAIPEKYSFEKTFNIIKTSINNIFQMKN